MISRFSSCYIMAFAGILISAFSMSAHGMPGAGETGTGRLSSFVPIERARSHPITANTPAPDFFEGALLGNGGMGVVVCTRPDAVVLRFGHNNVWDIRISESTKGKTGTFREVFERVSAIPDTLRSLEEDAWYRGYVAEMRADYDKPYPRPFPCGSIVLWFDRREAELLGHRLDIADGVCEIDFRIQNKIRKFMVFVDQTKDQLWARMVDEKGSSVEAPFREMEILPDPSTPKAFPRHDIIISGSPGGLGFRQALPFGEFTEPGSYRPHSKDRGFSLTAFLSAPIARKKRLTWEGIYEDPGELTRSIEPDKDFIFCAALDEGLHSDLTRTTNAETPDAKTYMDALDRSREAWEAYWKKSGVLTQDPLLERTWYHNLYFLKCSLRPGAVCPGLFANWSYGTIGTAWHGDYHLNYNTQQAFWAVFSCNHAELNIPYIDMVYHLLPVSRKWAKEYYGLRGAFFPHSSYPVEMTTMPYPLPHWGWEVFETPWTVQGLWWHYLYTQDEELLRDRLFGPIKESVLFLVDYMKRPDARGARWGDDEYHIFPSVPPELYGLRPGFDKNYDTNADLSLAKFIFKAFMDACDVLGFAESERQLLSNIRDILDHLPAYPVADSPRGKVYVSVEGEDPETVYNCPASLMNVFPGEDIGLYSPGEELELARATYLNQQNEGGNDLIFLSVQAARLGMLDIERFKRQIEYCLLPNGSCADMVLQVHGRYSNTTPFDFMAPMGIWFENFGLPLVINECMLQSYDGTLRFFPNWKEKTAEFRDLRAAGAFLSSARWEEGNVRWIEILSERGQALHMILPWEGGARCRYRGEDITMSGSIISLETKPGETIQFFPAQ